MSSTRRHMQLEYGSCDPSPNTHGMYNRDLDDSDTETWNSERIIKVNDLILTKVLLVFRKSYSLRTEYFGHLTYMLFFKLPD